MRVKLFSFLLLMGVLLALSGCGQATVRYVEPGTCVIDGYDELITNEDYACDRVLGTVETAEDAASKAAEIWLERYGEDVEKQMPYQVFFDAERQVWLVTGTLKEPLFGTVEGGVANILIQKADGRVLAVWHTK